MADDVEPRAGELTTANYGWTKPNVGNSDDAWGGMLNADLDGIDSTVKSVSAVANAAYPASNPSGYQTAANVTASLGGYLALSGGTMIGAMTLAANPAAPLQPATKQYVDALPVAMNDNRIINGDMRIDQRNNGASALTIGYTVDRWGYYGNQTGKIGWGRNLFGAGPPGFPYNLGFASQSAYTPLAGDIFEVYQQIEADMIGDFQWGTANAQPVTLSFWAFSSLTGNFSGSLRNYAGTRTYPFIFSIPTANIWTRVVLTIPGDTGGTWVMSGNAGSLSLAFDLGCGATSRGSAGAWVTGAFIGVTGSVSLVTVNAQSFCIAGVKLEVGSVATPYNRQSLAKSQADCERYCRWVSHQLYFTATGAGQQDQVAVPLSPAMRASPTMAALTADPNLSQQSTNNSANGFINATPYSAALTITAAAAGGVVVSGYRSLATAEL